MKVVMDVKGSALMAVKRGSSTSSDHGVGVGDVIKIKRTGTPDDISLPLTKGDRPDPGEDEDEDAEEESDEEDDGQDTESTTAPNERPQVISQKLKRRVSHGYHLVEGKMDHGMEDYLVATNQEKDGYELGLYAIFDGHSGSQVANYLQKHLFDNILNESDFWTNPKAAVNRAYQATDEDILDNVAGSMGGSTAVTAILINREKLIVANVGDSRAVLRRNGKAKPITKDHDPLKEKEMVESKGGFVCKKPGNVPRVDGQLAMTRAFGDERLKDHITAEPDIFVEKIDEDTEFVILASDGLWKVMGNQEAVDCILVFENGQEAAEELINEALARKSKDDISCVVVMFH